MLGVATFVVAVVITGELLGPFWLFVFSLAVVYALLALSLVVLTGWSGQLNLHVAALGLGWGAYAAFALVTWHVPTIWALVLAGIVTVPFAALVAVVAVQFRGLELAVATLAIGLIFERLFFRNIGKALAHAARGATPFQSSFVSMPRPRIGGVRFGGDAAFFSLCLAVAVVLFWVVGNLNRASTGRTLRALSEREVMAETLGVPVIPYRIAAFVLSIVIAGTAGGLYASLKLGIAPDPLNLDLSFQILAATVIGGIASPIGAVIAGALTALLPQIVRVGHFRLFGGDRLFVLFGVGMVLVLWRRPGGLAGLARRARRAVGPAERDGDLEALPISLPGVVVDAPIAPRRYASPLDRHAHRPILQVDGLHKHFGGVVALDGVSLFVPHGEICALIGPNGAGKSTLFNCVNGLLPPDDGRVYLAGRDITDLPPHRRAAFGVGRTFQSIEVFRAISVHDNLMVAGHLTRGAGAFSEALMLPRAARSERALATRAREVMAMLGLDAIAERTPNDLPLGLLRVLELGMALVARPRLLLLDEPSAGLDTAETEALGQLVARVRDDSELSVLLVEHDMGLVARLAEHVYVLDFGTIIAEGAPDVVRSNPLVLEKYLGEDLFLAPSSPGETASRAAGRRRARR
jgi:branched-chain amino acid transport system permease protein